MVAMLVQWREMGSLSSEGLTPMATRSTASMSMVLNQLHFTSASLTSEADIDDFTGAQAFRCGLLA